MGEVFALFSAFGRGLALGFRKCQKLHIQTLLGLVSTRHNNDMINCRGAILPNENVLVPNLEKRLHCPKILPCMLHCLMVQRCQTVRGPIERPLSPQPLGIKGLLPRTLQQSDIGLHPKASMSGNERWTP